MSVIYAKNAMRSLAAKAQETVSNPNLTNAQKKTVLDKIDVDIKAHSQTIAVHDQASRLMVGGSSIDNREESTFGLGTKGLRMAPSMRLNEDELHHLYEAARTKSSYRLDISTKATSAGDPATLLPPTMLPGMVQAIHEPVRLLDHIPSQPIGAPSIEFISHSSSTGTAGVVARGAAKPSIVMNTTSTILMVRKIAATTGINDESLQDYDGFAAYVQVELSRAITDAENTEILNGDGTGEHILGLFATSGLLTRDYATDHTADTTSTQLDCLERAINDLRVGPAFCDPTAVVLHPSDWSKIRRIKNTYGAYLTQADPTAAQAESVWGVPVLTTTTCPVGTGLVGNLQLGCSGFIRNGFVLEVSNSAGSDFTNNITRFRAEERLTVGVARPAALVKVTTL